MSTNNQIKESSIKKSGPLVSVIVPIYNSEKYLKQCLSSIVNQSYENLQIILVREFNKMANTYPYTIVTYKHAKTGGNPYKVCFAENRLFTFSL